MIIENIPHFHKKNGNVRKSPKHCWNDNSSSNKINLQVPFCLWKLTGLSGVSSAFEVDAFDSALGLGFVSVSLPSSRLVSSANRDAALAAAAPNKIVSVHCTCILGYFGNGNF